jgi:hypothetical protein
MSYLSYLNTFGGHTKFQRQVFGYTLTAGPTVGVITNADPTVYATGEAMLVIDNTASHNSGQNVYIYPMQINMWVTAAGTAGTYAAVRFVMANATTWSSGGSSTPANSSYYDTLSGYTDTVPYGQIHFGDLTLATTDTARKTIWEKQVASKATAFAVGDVHSFVFGDVEGANSVKEVDYTATSHVARGSTVCHSVPMPVAVGPGCSLIMQPFFTDLSAGVTFGLSVVTVELGHPREAA